MNIASECRIACLDSLGYLLRNADRHSDAAAPIHLIDCAEICQTSVGFMARGSELHSWVCGLCAEICKQCAG